MQTMTITSFEQQEWTRLAAAASRSAHHDVADCYARAALRCGSLIPLPDYDALAHGYRAWLVFDDYQPAQMAAATVADLGA